MICEDCYIATGERRVVKNSTRQVCATCVYDSYCAGCVEHVNVCGTRVQRNAILYCEDCANNIMEQGILINDFIINIDYINDYIINIIYFNFEDMYDDPPLN